MPFKPPLTFEQLHAIGQRNRENRDVIALLHEIKRLHALALRFDQVCRSVPIKGGAVGMILDAARNELEREPVVQQHRADWQELDGRRVEPRDDEP